MIRLFQGILPIMLILSGCGPSLQTLRRASEIQPWCFNATSGTAARTYCAELAEMGVEASPYARAILAELYMQDENVPKAEAAARRALEDNPNLSGAHRTMAYVHLSRDEHDAAIASAQRASRIDYFPINLEALAVAYMMKKQWDEALDALRNCESSIESFKPQDRESATQWSVRCGASRLGLLYHEMQDYHGVVRIGPTIPARGDSIDEVAVRLITAAAYARIGNCDGARRFLKPTDLSQADRTRDALAACGFFKASDSSRKALLLPIRATTSDERAEARGVSALLLALSDELDGMEFATMSDVEALMERELAADAMGCDETKCAAEIGGALGVDLVVYCEFSKLGETRIVGLNVVNVADNSALARESARWIVAEDAEPKLREALNELVRKLRVRLYDGDE